MLRKTKGKRREGDAQRQVIRQQVQLNGHEFEKNSHSEGHRSLAYCTARDLIKIRHNLGLNSNNIIYIKIHLLYKCSVL